MNIRNSCLVCLCLILNIGYSVSQFGIGTLLNEFEGGYNTFNVVPSRNSFQPQYQQQPQFQQNRLQSSSSGSCDQYWAYESDYNGQYGVIRISRPDYRSSVLRVVLSIALRLPSQNVGSLKLTKSIESTVSDISQGLPLFYRVDFPSQNPVPHIAEIYYNDQLLCSAPRVTGTYVTTITLDHNLKTGLTHPPHYQPEQPWPAQQPQPDIQPVTQAYVPEYTTRRPPPTTRSTTRYTTPAPRRTTTKQPPFVPPASFDDDQCGVPSAKPPTSTGLILGGQEVYRGQYPWLAALYYSPQNDQAGFICGGSLISSKLVVTAAHCIQRKEDSDSSRIKAEEILFHFGKRNLQTLESEEGHIFSAVRDVFIHPDWNYRTQEYDADIAIAILSRTIIFNKFVKPICLWTATNSFEDLVGVKGVVAGWGVDENKVVTTARPKWANIPVVTTEACLRSHSSFRTLTSERTFCAGESLSSRVGGSGPCNGDSGGGFVVKSGDKWYLRGIISAALVDQESGTCNPETFSVFTDATKFTSWIQNYMSQNG